MTVLDRSGLLDPVARPGHLPGALLDERRCRYRVLAVGLTVSTHADSVFCCSLAGLAANLHKVFA